MKSVDLEKNQLFESVVSDDNSFVSKEERQEVKNKQKELGVPIKDMTYEDWNYVLSAIKNQTIRNSTLMFAKMYFK